MKGSHLSRSLYSVLVPAFIASAFLIPALASADTVGPITFETPTYTIGNINAQDSWSALGSAGSGCAVYDEGVAASGGVTGFGAQSFRISNAVTSGCFSDQAFAHPVVNQAGETGANNGTFPTGTLQTHFESQFDIAAISGSTGDVMSVSPDRGDGARMSYLRFDSEADGIHVYFDDVTDPTHAVNEETFNETQIATLDASVPHTIKFSMDFYDGPDNDVVNVYIDGNLKATGTSWEDYYRYDTESNPSAPSNYTPTVRTMLFRAGGTAVPANAGKGFLIDNLSLTSGPISTSLGSGCTAIQLASGVSTFSGGWTNGTNVSGGVAVTNDATGLNPANYTYQGSFVSSVLANLNPTGFTLVPGPWTDPSTGSFAGSGAAWISDIAAAPGDTGGEGVGTEDQWRIFQKDFAVPAGATVSPITLYYTADNAVTVYFNGVKIGDTSADLATYGPTPGTLASVFGNTYSATFTPVAGQTNTLSFVVRNSSYPGTVNPTGLLYNAQGQYCAPIAPPTSVSVHIFKDIDGVPATAALANNAAFPMTTTFNSSNIGTATNAPFTLNPSGWGAGDSAYEASFNNSNPGANYAAQEVMDNQTVGASCDAGAPFALLGYRTGTTLALAQAATDSSTAPSFTNLQSDEYVIVDNHACPVSQPTTLKVHIEKFLDGQLATAVTANNYVFPMSATWQTANLNGGAQASGPYTLGTGWGGATGYAADTAAMQAPADYSTSEVVDDPSSQVVSTLDSCAPGKYVLTGYQVSNTSFTDAATQPISATAGFTGLTGDAYVIVDNASCPTTATLTITKEAIGGDGTFNFTSTIPGHPSFSITTTGHTGSVTFNGIAPGAYTVTEVNMPKGWTQTDNTCTSDVLTLTAAENVNCIVTDTSNKLLGSIRGTKYEDRDGDGTLKDGDHHELSGVTIFLDTNNNGTLDNGETSMTTNKQGFYDFTGLPAGTYHVCEAVPTGWVQTYPKSSASCYTVTLTAGQNAKKKDFGDFKPGTISGMKFNDVNGNGRKDSSDTGLAGWTIVLKGPHGFTTSMVTDANGNYSFTNLAAGTYTLSEVAQAGWTQTVHPYSVTVVSGTNSKNDNFGNTQHPKKYPTFGDGWYGNNSNNNHGW